MKWLMTAAVLAGMSGALSAADFYDFQRLRASEIGPRTMAADQINAQRPVPRPAADAIAKNATCMQQCMVDYAVCIKQADNASAPRYCEYYLTTCEAKCQAAPRSIDRSGTMKWNSIPGMPEESHDSLLTAAIDKLSSPGLKELFRPGADTLTRDALLRGNFLTDIPTDRKPGELDYFSILYPGATDLSHWIGNDSYADVHFTRARDGSGEPYAAKENCLRSVSRIKAALRAALKEFNNKNAVGFLNLIGHTTHTIQDSFSPAHTVRNRNVTRVLEDICTYKYTLSYADNKKTCEHLVYDERDFVRSEPIAAGNAVEATRVYLEDLGAFFLAAQKGGPADWRSLDKVADRYFIDRSQNWVKGRGAFVCEDLAKVP